MGHVADLLRTKGSAIYTISSDATVYEAIVEMVRHNVGSILVVEGTTPVGIFTERDYLREIALKGRTSRSTKVQEIMIRDVIVVDKDRTLDECMAIMTERRIRHLPVIEDERLIGLISIGDVVKRLSQDRKAEIKYLTNYITGKYPA
ncbi:MAG TPA: CBS domain-containing protein [Candidatus Eisenbacteria bacterium]|nr:CBS domain-containing protein [Candidatus Eisenbacteria bacterium]